MQRRWWMTMMLTAVLATGLALLAGCGGSGDGEGTAAADDAKTPPAETEATGTDEAAADEGALANLDRYRSVNDPDAVYTYDDIPQRGNYIRVNFEGLTDEQVNRVVHRLRTEKCNCAECQKDDVTLDECLLGRHDCGISERTATDIVAEEKRKEN